MAYTHKYILYNCDLIVLTHSNHVLTYLFPHIPSHSFQQFKHTTYGQFWSNSHKPGTDFNSPKNRACGLSVGSPQVQPQLHFLKPISSHFRPPTHQNKIYLINHHTAPKTVPKSATNCTNEFKKFQHSVPRFETDQTATHGLNPTQTSTKHLNQE